MLFTVQITKAQDNKIVDFNVTLESNHLWRGLIISDMPTLSLQTNFFLNSERTWTAGFWGGQALSRDDDGTHYKEINYFVQYANKYVSFGLWDLFNTRGVDSPDIWNYDDKTTGHTIDFRSSFFFGEKLPLRLEIDAILYGSGDLDEDDDQKYSIYTEISYPLYNQNSILLNGFVGAGFALNGDTHLYGDDSFNIVNVGLKLSKTVKIGTWSLPVNVMSMWNPATKFSRIQVAVNLF